MFLVLVDVYKKVDMLKPAADVVLLVKGRNFAPSLRSCNALSRDLVKANMMELF